MWLRCDLAIGSAESPHRGGCCLLRLGLPLAVLEVDDVNRALPVPPVELKGVAFEGLAAPIGRGGEPSPTALAVADAVEVDALALGNLVGFLGVVGFDKGLVTDVLRQPEVASRVVLVEFKQFDFGFGFHWCCWVHR